MKILYSIQATGNGHISRAMELLPYLNEYGAVDLFLSGSNSTLSLDAPIKYRSAGLSLHYTCDGKLDFKKMVKHIAPIKILKQAWQLPVKEYDLIINDFDCVTSIACALHGKKSVNFGHQASFQSALTPRPKVISQAGEWILRNYGKASNYVGLHFEPYDDFILPPVIKDSIRNAKPNHNGYYTIYLPSFCDKELSAIFSKFSNVKFEIFSRNLSNKEVVKNMTFIPVSKKGFNESLIYCDGIITGGGFETPAEALYLKKKIIAIPINGQYEQECNAAALQKLGCTTLSKIDDTFADIFDDWHNNGTAVPSPFKMCNEEIVSRAMRLFKAAMSAPEEEMIPNNNALILPGWR